MTALVPIPERRKLRGHLRLVCAIDPEGRSYLREQSFCVPFHLSKPFRDNGILVVNVINPTAGLFQGDITRSEVIVASNARLLLTNPGATRVHDTQTGRSESAQHFSVRSHGWLEVLPELFIPQKGARHRQKTSAEIETSGELIFLEMLAPGRVASGEVFAFEELDWETEIRYGGRLVAREKYILSPGQGALRALARFLPNAYVATFFLITERLPRESSCWAEIDSLHARGLWIGASQLVAGGWVIKMIAGSSTRLRETIASIREIIFRATAWPFPALRKL